MNIGNSPTFVSNPPDAAAIRAVFPDNTTKRLSRLLGIPPKSAEAMLYRGVPKSWVTRLARALLEEMRRQNIDRSAIEYRLALYAAQKNTRGNNAATAGPVGRVAQVQVSAEAREGRMSPPS